MWAFTKVVSHGSFSEAARDMRLSRSAVSKYIIDLEAELGVQLLNRSTHHASPTDAGQHYYERCVAILSEIEEADLAVSHLQAEPRGTLRVNAPMSFGTMHLGTAVSDFMLQYPGIRIQLVLSDQHLDTVQEGFDVTLRIADAPPPSLTARQIAPAPRVLCASPDYLKRAGTPRHPHDLRGHDCLNYGYLATGTQWKLTGRDGEDHWIHPTWKLSTNNGEILRDAALGGHGIALLPTFIVGEHLRSGSLRAILPRYKAPETSIYALYPPARYLPVKLRAFVDFLSDRFFRKTEWNVAHR
ncbi:LysR family transcriptional regulator [Pigmentiphaga soli]|uniref:LysR family transcriptional regulator n=1 Tax=Pigmentiphaga soli TaxID=1007095 RepID=A0ABP8GL15_9BURK